MQQKRNLELQVVKNHYTDTLMFTSISVQFHMLECNCRVLQTYPTGASAILNKM